VTMTSSLSALVGKVFMFLASGASVTRLAFDKARVRRRLAIADLVIVLVIMRHWRAPLSGEVIKGAVAEF